MPPLLYKEILPSAEVANTVECYWTLEANREYQHRVVPDGCMDIIFYWREGRLNSAQVVGTMTRPQLVSLFEGQFVSGARFHPGRLMQVLGASAAPLTDQEIPLSVLVAPTALELNDRIHCAASFDNCILAIEAVLRSQVPSVPAPALQALLEIGGEGDRRSVSVLAETAFLSERQFRRICLRETGVSPKSLERIVRFRKAWLTLHNRPGCSVRELAREQGFSDQAHLIREFREFAGVSPGHLFSRREAIHGEK
jgi:AraC-like DNA-binding protein